MYEQYLNKPKDDKRSPNEIALSAKLTSILTQLNLKRIHLPQNSTNINFAEDLSKPKSFESTSEKKRILFICLTGIPPFLGEFENFTYPGEVIKYVLPGFESGLNEEERCERALKSDLNFCASELNEKIDEFPSDYSLVFVCHSFGTYVASYFFKNYYEQKKDRIKGIIEMGGSPIRIYKPVESLIVTNLPMSREFIIENIDFIYDKFKKINKKLTNSHVPIHFYYSKYLIMSICLITKTEKFNELFELGKKMPKILKLFVYGEQDKIFDKGNSDEKTIYILYHKDAQLNKDYETQLSEKFTKIHKEPVKNLQEKFIYKIPEGKHSLHMQKQLTPLLQKLIDDYLQLIL